MDYEEFLSFIEAEFFSSDPVSDLAAVFRILERKGNSGIVLLSDIRSDSHNSECLFKQRFSGR